MMRLVHGRLRKLPSCLAAGMLVVACSLCSVHGAIHYVQLGATGSNNGSSWANAWNELNQIAWASVNPGDTVKIGGGNYTTALTLSKTGGSSTNRIRIERATEAGHNSKVTLHRVLVTQPFHTIDGLDKNLFEISSAGGYMIEINIGSNADYFELKNLYLSGTPSQASGMIIFVRNGSLSVDRCEFYGQVGAEDHIKFYSSGNLKIENSIFRAWASVHFPNEAWQWTHSDLVEGCSNGPCPAGSFIFRQNLVDDSGTNTTNFRYGNDVFMMNYTDWQSVDVSYNVFSNVGGVMKFYGADSMRIHNNVYNKVAQVELACYGSCSSQVCANNIYAAQRSDNNDISYCNQNSLWVPGEPGYVAGSGNVQGNPSFINPNSILGADGIGFTADDGFNIQSISSAINKGVSVGGVTDIRGMTIAGLPDMGAYEFGGAVVSPQYQPADIDQDWAINLNEVTSLGACWKSNCKPEATMENAVRAGYLWNATANGAYHYTSGQNCPECWEPGL